MNKQVLKQQVKDKKITKRFALFLCAQLLAAGSLTGCGQTDGQTGSTQSVVSQETAENTVVMTIEDYDVNLDEMYLYLIQYCYNNRLSSDDVDASKTEDVINSAISEMKLEIVEYLLAQNTELDVTEDDLATVSTGANAFYEHFGEEFLSSYGIDYDCVEALFTRQVYISAITDKAMNDMIADYTEQYEEQYADLTFHTVYYALFPSVQYDEDGNAVTDDDGNYVALSDEEMQKQYALAEELHDRAVAGEKMEDLVEEYGIDYCSGTERNYDGAYAQELNDVLSGMAEGDISDVITTDAGYMVVRMDNLNDEDYKAYTISYMASQNANNLLPTMQENWLTQSGVENVTADDAVLDTIDLAALCKDMENRDLY
jgi:hypothetical protein